MTKEDNVVGGMWTKRSGRGQLEPHTWNKGWGSDQRVGGAGLEETKDDGRGGPGPRKRKWMRRKSDIQYVDL